MTPLTPDDQSLLDTASQLPPIPPTQWPSHIHARHGNDTMYWQRVNALLDTKAANEYAPQTCAWLRRRRRARDIRAGRLPGNVPTY